MKTKKKLLCMLLALTMCIGMVHVSAVDVSAAVEGTEDLSLAPAIALGTTYTVDVNDQYGADLSLPKKYETYYYKISVPELGKYTYTFGSAYGSVEFRIKDSEFNNVLSKNVYRSSAIDTIKLNAGTYYIGIYTNDDKASGIVCLRKSGTTTNDPGYNETERIYSLSDVWVEGAACILQSKRIGLNSTYTFDVNSYYDANLSLPQKYETYFYKILVPDAGKYTYTFGSAYSSVEFQLKDSEFNNVVSKNTYRGSASDTVKLDAGTYYIGIYTNDEKANGIVCLRKSGTTTNDPAYNEAEKIYTASDVWVEGSACILQSKRIALGTTYTFDVNSYQDANLSLPQKYETYYYKVLVPDAGKYTYSFGSSYGSAEFQLKDSCFNNIVTKNVYQSSAIDTVKLNAGTYYIGIYTNDEKATGKISLKKAASLSKVTISSVSGKKKGFSVKWKKVASASGYQVQYATDSKMKSAKSKKVSSSNASFSVSGLKAKKTYYVRVRAYSKNADGTTTYGNWSSIKSVKTK